MPGPYYATCQHGHVLEVVSDTPLAEKCKKRDDEGALDAIGLSADECPECLEDKAAYDRRFASTCADAGCAFMDETCAKGCIAQREVDSAKSSPYDGMLRGLMPEPTQ